MKVTKAFTYHGLHDVMLAVYDHTSSKKHRYIVIVLTSPQPIVIGREIPFGTAAELIREFDRTSKKFHNYRGTEGDALCCLDLLHANRRPDGKLTHDEMRRLLNHLSSETWDGKVVPTSPSAIRTAVAQYAAYTDGQLNDIVEYSLPIITRNVLVAAPGALC